MAVRSVTFHTIALFVGIAALVLHVLALCSPHWKITKRDREPIMAPTSYGIWERCEYTNVTIIRQGVTMGTRKNVQFCYPNVYMRYTPEHYTTCNNYRRRCSVLEKSQIPEGCSCRYLPSAKGLQWLTILAALTLILGLLLIYLKLISSSQNRNAALLLSYGPFIVFLLTLLLMASGLILFGAYYRRDTYEDHSFPLQSIPGPQTFDLHSLRNYAKHHGESFTREHYIEAEKELREDAKTHYHTAIGRGTIYEIIATLLVFIGTVLVLWLGPLTKTADL